MLAPISFIGRTEEVGQIRSQINSNGNSRVICIYGEGGIGKSRLLREIYNAYRNEKSESLNLTSVIDFDDLAVHIPENVHRRISQMISSTTKSFVPYVQAELDFRKIQSSGVSSDRLKQEKERVDQSFVDCFNTISALKRVVVFIDTTDKLDVGKEVWQDFETILPKLKNVVVLIAGRNANELGASLQTRMAKEAVMVIHLTPLEKDDSKLYLEEKAKQRSLLLEEDVADKLIFLSGGKPVLLDLAVEWRARGISLTWLADSDLQTLQRLKLEELNEHKEQFEKHLVIHIKERRTPMNELVLFLAHIYPASSEMIKFLTDDDQQRAKELFEEAKGYAFVKVLPNNFITLHDEMRRMVNDHVWDKILPSTDRRSWYSEQAIKQYRIEIESLESKCQALELESPQTEIISDFDKSLQLDELQQQTWVLKEQLLANTLVVNVIDGFKVFMELFEEAAKRSRLALRPRFIDLVEKRLDKLPIQQRNLLTFYRIRQLFSEGEFEETKRRTQNLLKAEGLSVELKIDILILKGNAEIRLGEVGISIDDFKQAVELSRDKFRVLEIRSLTALGWAYRLTGNLDQAQELYQVAQKLCFDEGDPQSEALSEIYGLILNNYAYAQSNDNSTRRAAINNAHAAIKHWEEVRNDIGLGAGYLVLGIAYYRSDHSESALEAFQKSLSIFEPLKSNDWLGQIYSWRGAQFQDRLQFDRAEKDFHEALRIGSKNIRPMTLNRLARVYMNRQDWDLAEKTMRESLEEAKRMPDYIYWLGSLARLISIAAKKGEAHRLDEFWAEVEKCEKDFKHPDENSLGIAYLGLAKLGFMQNDPNKTDLIIAFLKKGIPLVVEHGSFVRADIVTRLKIIENDFDKTATDIISKVGQEMKEFILSTKGENISYNPALGIMFKWSNWKGTNR